LALGDARVDGEGIGVEGLARRDHAVAARGADDAAEGEVTPAVEAEEERDDGGVAGGLVGPEEAGGGGEHAGDERLAELDRAPVAAAADRALELAHHLLLALGPQLRERDPALRVRVRAPALGGGRRGRFLVRRGVDERERRGIAAVRERR